MYTVIGCSNCESVKIVEGDSKTTTCNRCQTKLQMNKVRVIFRSDSLEEAKEARSLAMAERNGFDYLATEMVDREIFDDDINRQVAGEAIVEEKAEESKEEIQAAGDIDKPKTAEEKDPKKRIVMDAIEFIEEPTDDDVIDFATERGVDQEYAVDIIDKLCMEGEAMRTREGTIRLL